MKKLTFLLLLLTIGISKSSFSQKIEKADSLGLPGDNLNLYAVLDLFQKSKTFEEFEKKLNSEDSKINNLDLNNDGKTDYIKVIDHQTGESHAVVMQVPVNEKETQDVAVIEIEKDKAGKVIVQIVGNEELYGKDYIVEPIENDPTAKAAVSNPNKKSDTTTSADGKTVIINNTTNNYNTTNNTTNNAVADNSPDTYIVVESWPIIHYVYAPGYVIYSSPWYWFYYPVWWSPWSPWYWHDYYWYHYDYEYYHHHHYGYYHRTTYYRAPIANTYYGPRRSVSVTVQNNRRANVYHKTYASKNRDGDGKTRPGKSNPAYNSKAESKGNNVVKQKPNDGMNKTAPKQNGTVSPRKVEKEQPKKENKVGPRPTTKPAASKPTNKPAQRPSSPKPTNKGGGRMGR